MLSCNEVHANAVLVQTFCQTCTALCGSYLACQKQHHTIITHKNHCLCLQKGLVSPVLNPPLAKDGVRELQFLQSAVLWQGCTLPKGNLKREKSAPPAAGGNNV